MTMAHFPRKELAYAVAFVSLLAGLYIGSYYVMVQPQFWEAPPFYVPEYLFGGDIAKAVFAAWHEVDLRLRPEYWHPSFGVGIGE
jgi:hypothetical protein